MSVNIYSTLSAPVEYTFYKENSVRELGIVEHKVRVEGGANIVSKNFLTPEGILTVVSDGDYELLRTNKVFILHVENGFIKVEKNTAPIEKIVASMQKRDNSAPLTKEICEKENLKVKVNKN